MPSLPQVVQQLLEACQAQADYNQLGQLISQDAGLSARVLALANSCFFHGHRPVSKLSEALLRLGTERLRSMALTVALQQYLHTLGAEQQQQLRDTWRDALACALLGRSLASLTGYPAAEDAFLAGLLHNIGDLIQLAQHQNADAPQPRGAPPQSDELSARLASHWQLDPPIVEAIAQCRHAPTELLDSPQLSQVVSLARALSLQQEQALEQAEALFGLTPALTAEVCRHISQELSRVADSLGIPLKGDVDLTPPQRQLTRQLRQALSVADPAYASPNDTGEPQQTPQRVQALLHEIGNPLAIIRNYITVLGGKAASDPALKERYETLQQELDRAAGLLMQARDPEHYEATPGPVALDGEIRALAGILEESLFQPNGQTLTLSLPESPVRVQATIGALRQILLNLIRNSADAMGQGGTLRIVLCAPLWQSGRQWAELSLVDDGPGLPAAVSARLFQPLAGHQKGTVTPGRGLGLSIVKQLMDQLQGIISCHSSPQGTAFRLLIPLSEQEQ
ncbi:MAG: HDOD domain-containing protein [Oleiphilaceae bacterium]|nr:HDOD domain-containing protein [Oleiphilaceae bacterium]